MFGSIDIHVKQCEELFRKRESKKRKKHRKKLPTRPGNFSGKEMSRLGNEALQQLASQVQESYSNLSLVKCKWCQRTMNEKALIRHNVLCTRVKPMRSVTDPVRRGHVAGLTSPPGSTAKTVPFKPLTAKIKRPPRRKKRSVCLPPPHSESEELRLKQSSKAAVLRTQGNFSKSNNSEHPRLPPKAVFAKRSDCLNEGDFSLMVQSGVKRTSSFKDSEDNDINLFKESSRVWVSPPKDLRKIRPKTSLWDRSAQELASQSQALNVEERPKTSITSKHRMEGLSRPKTSITNMYRRWGKSGTLKQELIDKADGVEKKMVAAMEELASLRQLIDRLE